VRLRRRDGDVDELFRGRIGDDAAVRERQRAVLEQHQEARGERFDPAREPDDLQAGRSTSAVFASLPLTPA
jgi:hypothetical protein